MASALPARLKDAAGLSNGEAFQKRHHGKSQSHVVSAMVNFVFSYPSTLGKHNRLEKTAESSNCDKIGMMCPKAIRGLKSTAFI